MQNLVPQPAESNTPSTDFVPPRHWIGVEELRADYWNDPKIQERRSQEFFDKPIETIALIDQTDKKGIARRDFLTIMGASMAMASLSCARRPVHKIIPYVIQPEEITPGVSNYYASTWPESGAGILIKVREGRPVKLEGNPDHPMNQGSLSARGQAALLDLYDVDRLREPLQRSREGGASRKIGWSEADQIIQSKLKAASSGSNRVRVLSGQTYSPSTRKLIQEFLAACGSASGHVEFEPLSLEEIHEAQAESYGTGLVPHYKFDKAEVVLSLGADFLGTWISPLEYSKGWVKNRKLDSKSGTNAKLSKLYCFESTMTVTGANADERFPVRPGDELKVAMAIAHELVGHSTFAGDSSVQKALSGYEPAKVAADIGLQGGAGKIAQIAHDLWASRGKGIVVGGDLHAKTQDALALQVAINFLNSLLENEGATVDGTANPDIRPAASFAAFDQLLSDMAAGKVDVLIIHRSNPGYVFNNKFNTIDALKKVSLIVHVSDKEDETAPFVDFVLPDHHFLENWGDAQPRKTLFSIQQPAIAPIHSTRAFEDSLLSWIKGAELKAGGISAKTLAAPTHGWHEYLMTNWRETLHREAKGPASFDQFWEGVLRDGVYDTQSAQGHKTQSTARSFKASSLGRVPAFQPGPTGDQVVLSLYQSVSMGDGRTANNAWLMEMPDPVTKITWDNGLNISPALAKRLDIAQDDVVEVNSGDVKIELPVNVQPGMPANVVSVAVGFGRTAAGKVANPEPGKLCGTNVYPFLSVGLKEKRLVFSGAKVELRKTGKVFRLAQTQWHHSSEERPIINDITLADYKTSPAAAQHTDPHLRLEEVPSMWKPHEYKGYRWGMAIDLNSCTGCGACVISCQAENNIPVVGRDNVRVSREMHWIRIDRYYAGAPENPDVVFQPMLCQHCENAPCETVCPVLATVHDDEGLNVQVYNRCVGTRYCQNNCPYKVRRFNFFDHWKSYDSTMNLAWNPDVTVRSRGIMEKCTFCIQRIQGARDKAKDRGDKIQDGDIKTACQQTCPTDAIIFGNSNDENSRVHQMRKDPRNFRVLEILNDLPQVSYMTKVRNKEGTEHHGHH